MRYFISKATLKSLLPQGWKELSFVKTTCCTCRGPRFACKYPQPCTDPAPEIPVRFWHPRSMHTYGVHTYKQANHLYAYTKNEQMLKRKSILSQGV